MWEKENKKEGAYTTMNYSKARKGKWGGVQAWTNSNYSKAQKGMWKRGIFKSSTNAQEQEKESEKEEAQISNSYYSNLQRGGSLNHQ